MESRRRNPLRRYPTAVCISVLHFGLTQPKTRALNSPGAHPGMAQSLPSPGQRLREPDRKCTGIPTSRLYPPYAAKALQSFIDFPDRL